MRPEMLISRKAAQCATILVTACVLFGCGSEDPPADASTTSKPKIGVIVQSAVPKYDKGNYPKWFRKHGDTRMQEAQELIALAAQKIVKGGKCPYLHYVDLSDKSNLREFVFFGECGTSADDTYGQTERFYVSESELKSGQDISSEAELAWNHTDAHMACRDLIFEKFGRSNVDTHDVVGKSIRELDTIHRVVVRLDFDLEELGVYAALTAICHFDPGASAGSIDVFSRE